MSKFVDKLSDIVLAALLITLLVGAVAVCGWIVWEALVLIR